MMKQVNIIERFNTSAGLVFVIENTEVFTVGETVEDKNNKQYKIKSVGFPSKPTENNIVSLGVISL